jgi:hypothetical protein
MKLQPPQRHANRSRPADLGTEHAYIDWPTSSPKQLDDALSITLEECRDTVGVQRVVAVMWPPGDSEPTVVVAGEPAESSWRGLDPLLRKTFQDAHHQLPLTAKIVESPNSPSKAQGLVAVSSGAADVARHRRRRLRWPWVVGRRAGTTLFEAETADDEIRARVIDSGSWKNPAADSGNGGWGLVLLREISDSVDIDSTPTGTTVQAIFGLPTAAVVH